MENPVIIFGAQQLGKSALDIFTSNGIVVYCFLDDDAKLHQTEIHNVPVMGNTDDDEYLKILGKKCEVFPAEMLFETVLKKSKNWGDASQLMYVVGATQAAYIQKVRAIVPDHFLLVPGVGAQGGSLSEISKFGMNAQCGLLINSSRQIIYASSGKDFAEKAREAALAVQQEMAQLLETYLPA